MKKPKRKRKAVRIKVTYTHRDEHGMLWRFVGGRPVSELADRVMAKAGLRLCT